MPMLTIQAPAGFNSQVTRAKSNGRWYDGNLVRWRQGDLEKLPGWLRLVPDPFLFFIRRLHAWLDLAAHRQLFVGTDLGLQLIHETSIYDLDTETTLTDPKHQTWYLDNLGEDGLALVTGGPLRVYHPAAGPDVVPPVPPVVEVVLEAPPKSNGMIAAMPQAQIILWGTAAKFGGDDPPDDTIDPLMLRFSDVGTYGTWIAAAANQAGSYRLSSGSRIVAAIKVPQTILVFTDTDVWSMSYIGPPLVYGFTIMGTGCGLVAPHAVVTIGRTTYWQGPKGFWQFGDSGVQVFQSTVHDYIFEDLDASNIFKCHAGANSIGNEVMFFFPCRSDPFRTGDDEEIEGTTLSNEPTRYVKVSTVEQAWDSGKLGRTAWINNNVFGMPLGADLNYRVQQHERGFDDDDQPMRDVFAETGFAKIGDGGPVMSIDQCHPDFKWFGKNGAVNLSFTARGYPGGKQFSYGPFSMTETTSFFNPRLRSRYVAIRFDWVARKGFSARVGATLLQLKAAGRRP